MYTGYQTDAPFVIRYPRGKGEKKDWRNEMTLLPVGKGRKLREGKDIAVLSIGAIGNEVIKAIEMVELEGISVLPRQIEGVQVGVTLRQYKSYRGYKVSVRTDGRVDASAICGRLGGGGHRGAAGCTFEITDLDEVYRQVLASVRQELEQQEKLDASL